MNCYDILLHQLISNVCTQDVKRCGVFILSLARAFFFFLLSVRTFVRNCVRIVERFATQEVNGKPSAMNIVKVSFLFVYVNRNIKNSEPSNAIIMRRRGEEGRARAEDRYLGHVNIHSLSKYLHLRCCTTIHPSFDRQPPASSASLTRNIRSTRRQRRRRRPIQSNLFSFLSHLQLQSTGRTAWCHLQSRITIKITWQLQTYCMSLLLSEPIT